MLKKIVLSLFVLVALAAVPASACNPNPFLMQDECYSSCANWAQNYADQCTTSCNQTWCFTIYGTPQPCEQPMFDTCMGQCQQAKCSSLNECEDYCHEW